MVAITYNGYTLGDGNNNAVITRETTEDISEIELNDIDVKGYDGKRVLNYNTKSKIVRIQGYITNTTEALILSQIDEIKARFIKGGKFGTYLTVVKGSQTRRTTAYLINDGEMFQRNTSGDINFRAFNIAFYIPDGIFEETTTSGQTLLNQTTAVINFSSEIPQGSADKIYPFFKLDFNTTYSGNIQISVDAGTLNENTTIKVLNVSVVSGDWIIVDCKNFDVYKKPGGTGTNEELDYEGFFPYFENIETNDIVVTLDSTSNVDVEFEYNNNYI